MSVGLWLMSFAMRRTANEKGPYTTINKDAGKNTGDRNKKILREILYQAYVLLATRNFGEKYTMYTFEICELMRRSTEKPRKFDFRQITGKSAWIY